MAHATVQGKKHGGNYRKRFNRNSFNPRAGTGYFASFLGTGGGGCYDPPRVWPLIELELRETNERAGLHERKPMVPNFKVTGQPMTSEVRSNTMT